MSTTRDARKDQAENFMNCIVRNELLLLAGAVDIRWSCWALKCRVTVKHIRIFTIATRRPQIEILLVARPAMDHMLPVLILLNVVVPRRSHR